MKTNLSEIDISAFTCYLVYILVIHFNEVINEVVYNLIENNDYYIYMIFNTFFIIKICIINDKH